MQSITACPGPGLLPSGAMARGEMSVLVVGGGIGGLTMALALHERGFRDVTVLEASRELRELGVGINTLPHAIRRSPRWGCSTRWTQSASAPPSCSTPIASGR